LTFDFRPAVLGQKKRQKSQAPLGDVETPGSNEVIQG